MTEKTIENKPEQNSLNMHTNTKNEYQNDDEQFISEEEEYYEEESSYSLLDEEQEGNNKVKNVNEASNTGKLQNEMQIDEENEKEFKIINEDIDEQADSSSIADISDETVELKHYRSHHHHYHHSNISDSGSRPISSRRKLREARREERMDNNEPKYDDLTISERARYKRENNEERKSLHIKPTKYDEIRRIPCKEDGSLSSCGDKYDEKENEYKDKRQLKLEAKEAKRIARANRKHMKLERKEEKLHEKIDRRNARRNRHSKHIE